MTGAMAKILDKGRQVDFFILDYEKAFDLPLMNYLNYLNVSYMT